MASTAGAHDLSAPRTSEEPALSEAEEASLADKAERAAAEQRTPVATAFVVFARHDGTWEAHGDLTIAATLTPSRAAHADDFVAGCANITRDITAMTTANHVMAAISAQAQAAQAQMAAAQRGSSAMNGIDLSRLRG